MGTQFPRLSSSTPSVADAMNLEELLVGSIRRMSHVNRYSSFVCIRKENVAEHTFYVAMVAYCIARDIERNHGEKIDYAKLLRSAMLHDLDEALTGDVVRRVKYGVEGLKKILDKAASQSIKEMSDDLRIDLHDDWAVAKSKDLEGQIVGLADFFGTVQYTIEEYNSGNHHMTTVIREVCDWLRKVAAGTTQITDKRLWPYAKSAIMIAEKELLK